MANTISSLFKIDAAEGLVRYTNSVKPFHSKLLDVLIEYVYNEDVNVRVAEKLNTGIQQFHTTGGTVWDEASQTFVATTSACYFQVNNVLTTSEEIAPNSWRHSWVIEGHHSEKFLAGNRFRVTLSDATSKVFIVQQATNNTLIATTDAKYTSIVTVSVVEDYASKEATNIQLAVTPDYRVMGAVTGPNGSWIVDGDQRDQFQVGEQIFVATSSPNEIGASVYTISGPPTLGVTPYHDVDDFRSPDHTPDFSIVAVRPTRPNVGSDPFTTIPGQWVILGDHASTFIHNSFFSVENEQNTPIYYRVDTAVTAPFSDLDSSYTTPSNSGYLASREVTIVTIAPAQEIPETAVPSGILQHPVVPQYEIVGVSSNSWTITGDYSGYFQPDTVFFVFDNTEKLANIGYAVATALPNGDGTTTITVVGAIPSTATNTGVIHHPTTQVTFIPVEETVFDYWNARGVYYKPLRTGTLRYTPRVFNQIIEPSTTVLGTIWTNPVTNVSKRWAGQWIHTYTPTNYSWFRGSAPPSSVIIESATAQGHSSRRNTQITLNLPIFSTTGTGTPIVINGVEYTATEIASPYSAIIAGQYTFTIGSIATVMPLNGTSRVHHEAVSVRQAHTFTVGQHIAYTGTVWIASATSTPHIVTEVPDTTRFRFETTDTIPSTAGTVYRSWDVDEPVLGTPTDFTITATEFTTTAAEPDYGISNSFLVDSSSTFEPHSFTTISTQSNQLMFSSVFTIVGVDSVNNKWTVSGSVDVSPGETLYVTSSSVNYGLGQYVVSSSAPGTIAGTTDLFVTKQISRLASGDGVIAVPTPFDTLPQWVEGTRVKVSSTALLPDPLLASQSYYFIPVIAPFSGLNAAGTPTETPAVFALSKVRKPRDWNDYVDITTFGTGVLSITQDETYVPGTKIFVRDSFNSRNNGYYTILQSTKTSGKERIFVEERVTSTTPAGMVNDGVMIYDLDSHVFSSLTEKVCKAREQSGMHAGAQITEHIEFVFTIDEFDFIMAKLLENEPRTELLRELGFDIPDFDASGFDGEYTGSMDMSPMSGSAAYSHSMIEIGFDTQFFDVGGIDETTRFVAKKYGTSVR